MNDATAGPIEVSYIPLYAWKSTAVGGMGFQADTQAPSSNRKQPRLTLGLGHGEEESMSEAWQEEMESISGDVRSSPLSSSSRDPCPICV